MLSTSRSRELRVIQRVREPDGVASANERFGISIAGRWPSHLTIAFLDVMTILVMARRVSVAEAKTQLSSCIRAAEAGHPVVITRHGKAVVAIVSAADLTQLDRLRAAGPAGGLASLDGGWPGSDQLAELAVGARGRSRRQRLRLR